MTLATHNDGRALARYENRSTAVARCSCGTAYSMRGWAHLAWVGPFEVFLSDDLNDDRSIMAELRNCVCGSTITGPATRQGNAIEGARNVVEAIRAVGGA